LAFDEMGKLGDFSSPSFTFENYPALKRTGNIVPFFLRVLKAYVPSLLGHRRHSIEDLHKLSKSGITDEQRQVVNLLLINVSITIQEYSCAFAMINDMCNALNDVTLGSISLRLLILVITSALSKVSLDI
jgi:hypothetical protein